LRYKARLTIYIFRFKIDYFLVSVADLHWSVSLAAAPQLLRQELLSFIFGSTY